MIIFYHLSSNLTGLIMDLLTWTYLLFWTSQPYYVIHPLKCRKKTRRTSFIAPVLLKMAPYGSSAVAELNTFLCESLPYSMVHTEK